MLMHPNLSSLSVMTTDPQPPFLIFKNKIHRKLSTSMPISFLLYLDNRGTYGQG